MRFQTFEMRHSALAAFCVDAALDQGALLASDGQINRAFFGQEAFGYGEIGAVNFAALQSSLQNGGADQVFGDNQQTCRVAVQAIDAAEYEGNALLLIVPDYAVGQGVGRMADGRMDRNAGRFIDDKNIFIFIRNGKRNGCRHDIS